MFGALEGLDGLLYDCSSGGGGGGGSGNGGPSASSSSLTPTQVRDAFSLTTSRLELTNNAGEDLKRFNLPKAALALLGHHFTSSRRCPARRLQSKLSKPPPPPQRGDG